MSLILVSFYLHLSGPCLPARSVLFSDKFAQAPLPWCRFWRLIPFISQVNGIGNHALAVFLPEDFSGAFADDDARSHGIAGGHARHDRAVCNAKVFDPIA